MVRSKVTQKRYYESGSEEESEDDYASRPPAKKKGKASTQKVSQPRKIIYKDDFSDNSLSDPEEVDDDSDFGAPAKKSPKKKPTPKKSKKVVSKKKTPVKPSLKKGSKTPAKKTPAKKSPSKSAKKATNGSANGRHSGRKQSRKSYSYSSDEDEDEDESDEEEEEDSDQSEEESDSEVEEVYVKKGKKGKKAPPPKKSKKVIKKPKKPSHPPVGEMFTTAIKRLRDNPRKGSSIAAIKGFMAEEWGLYIQDFAPKIKKFVTSAVASGEVIQTKGKGVSGRFTVPGLKMKKKKRKNNLTKKWDEDEVEYVAKKSARDEEREAAEKEMEEKRQQRMEEAVRKELEKANQPKKVVQRKTEWEVEMIKGVKITEEETFYKVKWFGSSKMTWEPEENLRGCRDAIENFEIEEKTRIREEERRKKEMEENGTYEVSKILDVQFVDGGKREFLVRWKYCKANEDTWEPEDNLGDSEDLIAKFMDRYNQTHGEHVSEKTLREGPKQIERLTYTMKDIKGKSRKKAGWNGTRMTYYGMDDSDDE